MKNTIVALLLASLLWVMATPVSARKWISNDGKFSVDAELVEDKILIYSDGFVKTYETISEQEKNGLISIKIRAKIERRSVIAKLKAVNITTRKIDGQGLFAEIVTNMEAKKDATALLKKALADFPTLVTAESVGKAEFDKTTSEFVIDVLLKVDTKAYAAHQQRLEEVLAKICLAKGPVSIKAEVLPQPPPKPPLRICTLLHTHYLGRPWRPKSSRFKRNWPEANTGESQA